MIGRAELSRIALRSGVGERAQEKDYVLAWLLRAAAEYKEERIVFKGGTALRRCYFDDYRFSEDLDFTVTDVALRGRLDRVVERWCSEIGRIAGIDASVESDPENPEGRLWVSYTGPLLAQRKNEIKIDFSFDEPVLTAIEYPTIHSEYSDLPADTYRLPTYSLIEIWAEKTRSLLQRTQPRDVYDLVALARFDGRIALEAWPVFIAKTERKGIDPARLAYRIDTIEGRMRSLWTKLLAHQMAEIEPFEACWRDLRRALRSARYI